MLVFPKYFLVFRFESLSYCSPQARSVVSGYGLSRISIPHRHQSSFSAMPRTPRVPIMGPWGAHLSQEARVPDFRGFFSSSNDRWVDRCDRMDTQSLMYHCLITWAEWAVPRSYLRQADSSYPLISVYSSPWWHGGLFLVNAQTKIHFQKSSSGWFLVDSLLLVKKGVYLEETRRC